MTSPFDQRRDGRVPLESKIEYVLNHTDEVILEGDIIDVSQSGLCFQTTEALRQGQEIMVKNILPIKSQIGTVVRIEKSYGDYYTVGLQFK
jgi:hypothetical protein